MLQLPNKRDQERTLHLINELHHRVAELEGKLELARQSAETSEIQTDAPVEGNSELRVTRTKKTSNGSELVSIQ
jgi:hypothetical protein